MHLVPKLFFALVLVHHHKVLQCGWLKDRQLQECSYNNTAHSGHHQEASSDDRKHTSVSDKQKITVLELWCEVAPVVAMSQTCTVFFPRKKSDLKVEWVGFRESSLAPDFPSLTMAAKNTKIPDGPLQSQYLVELQAGGQASDRGSQLCFSICKCDTIG